MWHDSGRNLISALPCLASGTVEVYCGGRNNWILTNKAVWMWELSICCQSFQENWTEDFGLSPGKYLSFQLVVGKSVAVQVQCKYCLLEAVEPVQTMVYFIICWNTTGIPGLEFQTQESTLSWFWPVLVTEDFSSRQSCLLHSLV